jgi:hypothetical protein
MVIALAFGERIFALWLPMNQAHRPIVAEVHGTCSSAAQAVVNASLRAMRTSNAGCASAQSRAPRAAELLLRWLQGPRPAVETPGVDLDSLAIDELFGRPAKPQKQAKSVAVSCDWLLLGAPAVAVGRDAEQTPMVGVEDRAEDARRVEARAAVPIDLAVGAYERSGVRVADQAVLSDGQVARPRCAPSPGGHEPPSSTSTDGRASSASVLSAFGHEYELSRRRRALEQLVRSAYFGEWQALGHDRADLAPAKQLE